MRRPIRISISLAILGTALAAAVALPIPTLPDSGRQTIATELSQRLPGWEVERLSPSWEGAYTVVTSCAGHRIDFQLVPGHGLGPDDAWVLPADEYAYERLTTLSDHWRHLIWFGDPAMSHELACRDLLARVRTDVRRDATTD
jgi:hypothetical protein